MSPPDDDVPPPDDNAAPPNVKPTPKAGPSVVTVPVSASGVQLTATDKAVQNFSGWLNSIKPQLMAALPKHVRADRMLRIALTTVRRTPQLLKCTRDSLLGSIVQASQLGLELDPVLGEAHLIPRNEKVKDADGKPTGKWALVCTMMPGYKGLVKLARNTGKVSTIYSHVVCEQDKFIFEYGLNEKLKHKPSMEVDPGKPTFVYAFVRLSDGATQFEVMSVRQVEAIRARGKAGDYGPWVTDWDEMAKKTVIRKLCKALPSSVEMQRAVALDEAADAGLKQQFETTLAEEPLLLTAGGETLPDAPEVQPAKNLTEVAAAAKAAREGKQEPKVEEDKGDDPERDLRYKGPR